MSSRSRRRGESTDLADVESRGKVARVGTAFLMARTAFLPALVLARSNPMCHGGRAGRVTPCAAGRRFHEELCAQPVSP